MKRWQGRWIALLPALITAHVAAADEVETRLQRGLDAYRAGQYTRTLQELGTALQAVQARVADEYRGLLPPPPSGWDADDTEVRALAPAVASGALQLSRRYFREEEEIALEVSVDSPLLAGLGLMLSDPKLLAGEPAARPYRLGDHKGLMKSLGDETELSVIVGPRLLLRASATNVKDETVTERLLDSVDLAQLSRTLVP